MLVSISTGTEKFIHTEPWIMASSSTGSPADLNVNTRITSTNRNDRMLTIRLSVENTFDRS